ncbi:MAG: hypothetical protein JSR30_00300 [Proteobacteria bacterium]|nr:hypothetical protein [Pseudomonadota bacterium]
MCIHVTARAKRALAEEKLNRIVSGQPFATAEEEQAIIERVAEEERADAERVANEPRNGGTEP